MKKTSKYLILQHSVHVCHQQTQDIHQKLKNLQTHEPLFVQSLLNEQSHLLQSLYILTQNPQQLHSLQQKNLTQYLLFQAGAHSMQSQALLYQALGSLVAFLNEQALSYSSKRANTENTFQKAQQFLSHGTLALQMRFDALQLLQASAVPHNVAQHSGVVDALFLLLQSAFIATHFFQKTPFTQIPLFEHTQTNAQSSTEPDAMFCILKLQELSTQSLFSYLNHKTHPEEHTQSAFGYLLRQWLLFAYKALLDHPQVSKETQEKLLYPAIEKLALSSQNLNFSAHTPSDPLLPYLSPSASIFPTDWTLSQYRKIVHLPQKPLQFLFFIKFAFNVLIKHFAFLPRH